MAIHVSYDLGIEELPQECIDDCGSGGGSKDDAVAYWIEELGFTVDHDRAIQCLTAYGLGDDDDPVSAWDDERLASYVLWLACSDFSEWQFAQEAGHDRCGSDIFVLEG